MLEEKETTKKIKLNDIRLYMRSLEKRGGKTGLRMEREGIKSHNNMLVS